jgi:hypothetical protein
LIVCAASWGRMPRRDCRATCRTECTTETTDGCRNGSVGLLPP